MYLYVVLLNERSMLSYAKTSGCVVSEVKTHSVSSHVHTHSGQNNLM